MIEVNIDIWINDGKKYENISLKNNTDRSSSLTFIFKYVFIDFLTAYNNTIMKRFANISAK